VPAHSARTSAHARSGVRLVSPALQQQTSSLAGHTMAQHLLPARPVCYDYLRLASHPDLVRLLAAQAQSDGAPRSEQLLFADELIKINRKQKRQERVLLVTDRALYNFAVGSYKSAKRRIPARALCGVILSRGSDELVLQVSDDYDYRYDCRRRNELLEMLARAYELAHSTGAGAGPAPQLMVSFSDEAQLKDQVLTKDHLKAMQQVAANSIKPMAVCVEPPPPSQQQQPESSGSDVVTSVAAPSPPSSPAPGRLSPSASFSSQNSQALAPQSPSSRLGYATLQLPGAKSPAGKRNVRRSLITHGSGMLSPQMLAKIMASGGSIDANGFPAHAASAAPGPSGAAASPVPSPSSATFKSHTMKPWMFANLRAGNSGGGLGSGQHSRAGSKADSDTSSNGGCDAFASAPIGGGYSFRDPTSRVEGWLTKKKGSSTKWDRKYFILTSTHLSYFEPRIKGNASLEPGAVQEANLVVGTGAEGAAANGSGSTDDAELIVLRVECRAQKEPLLLAFPTEAAALEWHNAILQRNTAAPPAGADPDNDDDDSETRRPHLEGWLLHRERGGGLLGPLGGRAWARRYVVLTGDRIWFLEMALKGCISFAEGVSAHNTHEVEPTEQATSSAAGPLLGAGRASQTRFAHRFNVSSSDRIFYLAADSEEDCTAWIESIDAVNRENGRGGALAATDNDDEVDAAAAGAASSLAAMPASFLSSVSQPAPEGHVSFVFTDVQSSTSLWEKVPDAMDAALALHDRLLREILILYRGYEVKTEGDAFMVTFFTPVEATLWCLHVQLALLDAQWPEELCTHPAARREEVLPSPPAAAADGAAAASDALSAPAAASSPLLLFNGLRIRMGIHSGYPNARRNPITGRMDYFGPVVNRSARVSDTAHGGQVVATQEVVDAIKPILDEASAPAACETLIGQGVAQASLDRLRGKLGLGLADAPDELQPLLTDEGCHPLKGIPEPVRIFQVMPKRLALRKLPPLRD